MKINCSKCGKRFDADQYMYICPKCNHYHSQLGGSSNLNKAEKPVKKYRWETDPIELADEENYFKRRQKETEIASLDPPTYPRSEMKNVEEPDFIETLGGLQTNGAESKPEENDFFSDVSSVGKKIGLAVCIIIGFVMFIGSTIADFDSWSDDSGSWGDGWDTYSTEEEVPYGSPMEFEDFTVNVGDVTELTDENLDVNEGWKLVKVSFETDSIYTAEDEDLFTDVVMLHSYGDDSNWTEDGYYALYEDEVTNERKVEEQLAEDGLVTEAHYSGSYFWVFEIPENAEEVKLKVTTYVPDGEWGSYSQDEAITMPVEL